MSPGEDAYTRALRASRDANIGLSSAEGTNSLIVGVLEDAELNALAAAGWEVAP
jgi:hypothetical protein